MPSQRVRSRCFPLANWLSVYRGCGSVNGSGPIKNDGAAVGGKIEDVTQSITDRQVLNPVVNRGYRWQHLPLMQERHVRRFTWPRAVK